MKQKHLQQLFNKPMDRREFLAHVGAGILMIMGISGIIGRLINFNISSGQSQVGYGSSPYGGGAKH